MLKPMQEKDEKHCNLWPSPLNLMNDDFDILKSIVEVLKPVKIATNCLSSYPCKITDLLLTYSFKIEQMRYLSVPARNV